MTGYVAVSVIMNQGELNDVLMNFAGILVILEFDNKVGEWLLSFLFQYKDRMKIDLDKYLDSIKVITQGKTTGGNLNAVY